MSKAHARIIWDCCWSPDGRFFVTGSRDKTVRVGMSLLKNSILPLTNVEQVKIWCNVGTPENWQCVATLNLAEPVTAVAAHVDAHQ